MSAINTVGVIGLGNMGRGMALSLMRAGFTVTGSDPMPQAIEVAQKEGIKTVENNNALANCDVIVLSLPTTDIVEKVLEGSDGLAKKSKTGQLIIDTTSGAPDATREIAGRVTQLGLKFIDSPVSGGATGAKNGTLTMFIGGSKEDVEFAQPVLAAMGDKRFHIGDVGAGDVAKIVNNLLVASHLLTASEAFRLANAAGVKTEQLIEAINAGSGRSGVTIYNYPSRILNDGFNSGFTMQLMRKDVNLAMSLKEKLNLNLPVVDEVGDIWNASSKSLEDKEDFNRIVNFKKTAS